MQLVLRAFLSVLLLLAAYEFLVFALRQMNLPSDVAVYKGTACLAVLAFFLPFALWRIWRSLL